MPARTSFAIPSKTLATEGPVGIPVILALLNAAISVGDFALEQTSGAIGYVQSVYIDNSANAGPLTFIFGGTQQNITVKAHTQGYYPIVPFQGTFQWQAFSAGNAGALNVPVIFMNVAFEAAQWLTQ